MLGSIWEERSISYLEMSLRFSTEWTADDDQSHNRRPESSIGCVLGQARKAWCLLQVDQAYQIRQVVLQSLRLLQGAVALMYLEVFRGLGQLNSFWPEC